MAKKGQESNQNNQAAEGPKGCKAEDCKSKAKKFGFCLEHYELFMAGVLRGDGTKPVDYGRKLDQWKKKQAQKAA
ncbi:hypothetical protein GW916_05100 [bacterium]|nr:hypothetical protein [bacterium]